MEDAYAKYKDEFLELDKKEYKFLGKQLALFLESMLDVGFERQEAFDLTKAYTEFIFNMGVEDFIRSRLEQWMYEDDDEDFEEDDEVEEEDEEDDE